MRAHIQNSRAERVEVSSNPRYFQEISEGTGQEGRRGRPNQIEMLIEMGNGRSLSQVTQKNKGPLPTCDLKTDRTLQKTPERWLALPVVVSGSVKKAAA